MSHAEVLLLQEKLQHVFSNPKLLERALTHRSFSADHNERLEFLGDSVLNLSITHLLYQRLMDTQEGDLSRIRANLVKQETLHRIALQLSLPSVLRLGAGEVKSGGSTRPSILADAVEALVGAVFLDAGFETAQALVHRLYENVPVSTQMQAMDRDPKTELQEWLQARRHKLPVYQVSATQGALHQQTFAVLCDIPELGVQTQGQGASRRAGEQAAAQAALQILKAKKK